MDTMTLLPPTTPPLPSLILHQQFMDAPHLITLLLKDMDMAMDMDMARPITLLIHSITPTAAVPAIMAMVLCTLPAVQQQLPIACIT